MSDPNQPHAPGDQNPYYLARFIGFAFLAVGVLWTGLSGVCTLVMIIAALSEKTFEPGIFFPFLIIGLISAGIGFAIFVIGRVMVWPYRNQYPPPRNLPPSS